MATVNMNEDTESLKRELDDYSFQILFLCNEIINVKCLMQSAMASGFAALAQSRYIMGSSAVSRLQLPTEEVSTNALITIDRTANLQQIQNGETNHKYMVEVYNLIHENNTNKSQNPLRWFGVLVPQVLRKAQQTFILAAEYIAELATLQNELNIVMEYHKKLTISLKAVNKE